MNTPPTHASRLAHHRFDCDAAFLPPLLPVDTLACIQATNRLGGLGAVTSLGEIVMIDRALSFPETGLQLTLPSVRAAHGVDLEGSGNRAFAIEFAIGQHPRAVSIAMPADSPADAERRANLLALDCHEVATPVYQDWYRDEMARVVICPCCIEAAETRRRHPEANPIARILRHAADDRIPLRCSIVAERHGFTRWLTPQHAGVNNGHIHAFGDDGDTVLEIDPGNCHSLWIGHETLDGQRFTTLRIHDSLGRMGLRFSSPASGLAKVWRAFCHGDRHHGS